MATFNWPGFGISAVTPTLDQPAQVNRSAYTGVRAVASNPWHGKWSFKVTLATTQGDASFQAVRGFFTGLQGSINNFHLPAVEAPQNGNTGVTLAAAASQGATSLSLTGVTTALVAGNMATIAGQLLSLTSVGSLSSGAQTVNFMPALRSAASIGASVETAKPYALVALSDSSFSWDIAQWRLYGLSFTADEDVSGTDGASPALDVWTGSVGTGGSGAIWSFPQLTSFISRSTLAAVPSPSNKQIAYLTETGREGTFVFSTANLSASVTNDPNQGVYVAPSFDTTGASGAWVRKYSLFVSVTWFGAVGDGVTDDSAAFLAAIAYVQSIKRTGTAYGYGGYGAPTLFVPSATYWLNTTTLDITVTMRIVGENTGEPAGPSTVLVWADGTTGIRIQAYDTIGASGTNSNPSTAPRGDGTLLKGLFLRGGYTATESESYGIHLRGIAVIEDVFIDNFPGDGIYANTTIGSGGATEGQASMSHISRITVRGCRNGIYLHGADANICTINSGSLIGNRCWGIWDSSFLGNSYFGLHTASNGWGGAAGSIPTASTFGGSRYYVMPGQAAGASTNSPYGATVTITIASPGVVTWTAHGLAAGTPVTFASTGALPTGLSANTTYYVVNPTSNTFQVATTVGGTAINTSGTQSGTQTCGAALSNTYWGYRSAGGTFTGVVAWVSGTTFREGGSYKTDNANAENLFSGCYQEADQNQAQIQAPSTVSGGQLCAAGNYNSGASFRCDTSGIVQLGPSAGSSRNGAAAIENTSGTSQLFARFWRAGVPTTIGTIQWVNGNACFLDTATAGMPIYFRPGGSGVGSANINTNGLDLATGKILSVNGVQIAKARMTGWSTATGTASRATFDTGSVTLATLAQVVKALIDDLHATAGHGMIGP